MGVVKALFKLLVLLAFGAAVAGAVMLVRNSGESEPVTFEEWPDVPENPAV